ncbi:MAG TPA: hypothetical protein VEH84_16850 [Alphaproteobacteria bacterium]|nr:hypothetical protein [Alphaproteobacteria bacterium]
MKPGPARRTSRVGNARRLLAVLILAVAATAAIALFSARSVAERLQAEQLATQAEVVKSAATGLLTAGLPLRDFAGFGSVAQRVLAGDPGVKAVEALDPARATAFWRGQDEVSRSDTAGPWRPRGTVAGARGAALEESASLIRVVVPLEDRFGTAGYVAVYAARDEIAAGALQAFWPAFAVIAFVLAGSALHYLAIAHGEAFRSGREMGLLFAVPYAICLAALAVTLAGVTASRFEGKAQAFAESIGARLGEAVAVGLDLEAFTELKGLIREYQAINPDIGLITLVVGNSVELRSDDAPTGGRWAEPDGAFTRVVEIRPREILAPQLRVAAAIERGVAYRRLADQVPLVAGAVAAVLAFCALAIRHNARRARLG